MRFLQADPHAVEQLMQRLHGPNADPGLFKPEDFFASMQVAAAHGSSDDACNLAASGVQGVDGLDDLEGSPGPNTDKPLTSKFRYAGCRWCQCSC